MFTPARFSLSAIAGLGLAVITALTASLQAYPGAINQWGIGLYIDGHAAFIGAVYDRVIADANNA